MTGSRRQSQSNWGENWWGRKGLRPDCHSSHTSFNLLATVSNPVFLPLTRSPLLVVCRLHWQRYSVSWKSKISRRLWGKKGYEVHSFLNSLIFYPLCDTTPFRKSPSLFLHLRLCTFSESLFLSNSFSSSTGEKDSVFPLSKHRKISSSFPFPTGYYWGRISKNRISDPRHSLDHPLRTFSLFLLSFYLAEDDKKQERIFPLWNSCFFPHCFLSICVSMKETLDLLFLILPQ